MAADPLPYHCPTFKADFLLPPCTGKMAQIKRLQAKFPEAWLGPLDHCRVCKGAQLVTRELPDQATGKTYFIIEDPPEEKLPQELPNALGEKLPQELEECMSISLSEKINVQPTVKVVPPRCPKHPGEPQIAATGKRAGQYLGACLVCMQERGAGRKPKDNLTPAVARDLVVAPKPAAPAPDPPATRIPELAHDLKVNPAHPCKNHPYRESVIDSLGRNTRYCSECHQERGRRSGKMSQEHGKTGDPVSIPLNQGKYAELKIWLEEQAAENERSLNQEIMFRLKMSMRGANPLG